MASDRDEWRPGSFTKNFSWGPAERGLAQLHESIRIGFAGEMQDVSRDMFRERVKGLVEYIPINFFLFNKPQGGQDFLAADELVFQAITQKHSPRFDKLALFAFNFSYVGKWKGASSYQRRPALWAYHYIKDRVAGQFGWETHGVDAHDIEKFVSEDARYRAQTARKLATNLKYLYTIGRLDEFAEGRVERWWVDAMFLALDRLIEDRMLDGIKPPETEYETLLSTSGFHLISGRRSLEKDLASKHLVNLYRECGGRDRFSEEHVRERTELRLPDLEWFLANDLRPQGAVHPTNPRILKSIPRACAMLARYAAGFDVIDAEELSNFDPEEYIRSRMQLALQKMREQGISPTTTAEELMKLTRDR